MIFFYFETKFGNGVDIINISFGVFHINRLSLSPFSSQVFHITILISNRHIGLGQKESIQNWNERTE